MRRIIILLLSVSLSISIFGIDPKKIIIVLDPGHGGANGNDNGGIVSFDNKKYYESGYAYDVTLRLEKLLSDSGYTVIKTVKNSKRKISDKEFVSRNVSAIFTFDKTKVTSDKNGLSKRTIYTNSICAKRPGVKVVFLAIHFDKIDPFYFGARFIKTKDSYFLKILESSFKEINLISNHPLFEITNGDQKTYGRNIYVLMDENNKANIKILIELGNLNSPNDLKRAKNAKFRQKYAHAIFKAIKNYQFLE